MCKSEEEQKACEQPATLLSEGKVKASVQNMW
jgi:hypothetical protein